MIEKDPIQNPTVFIGNFEWREPVTTLTDFFIALICFYAVAKFISYKGKKSESYSAFKFYFLFFAFSMISAAWIGHGLVAYIGKDYKVIGWTLSTIAYMFLGFASLIELKSIIKMSRWLLLKNIFFISSSAFIVLLLYPVTSSFLMAQISSIVLLIGFILPMNIYSYKISRSKGNRLIVLSILGGILPAIVYNKKISLNEWFNYNDISHVLLAITLFIMYKGAAELSLKK